MTFKNIGIHEVDITFKNRAVDFLGRNQYNVSAYRRPVSQVAFQPQYLFTVEGHEKSSKLEAIRVVAYSILTRLSLEAAFEQRNWRLMNPEGSEPAADSHSITYEQEMNENEVVSSY